MATQDQSHHILFRKVNDRRRTSISRKTDTLHQHHHRALHTKTRKQYVNIIYYNHSKRPNFPHLNSPYTKTRPFTRNAHHAQPRRAPRARPSRPTDTHKNDVSSETNINSPRTDTTLQSTDRKYQPKGLGINLMSNYPLIDLSQHLSRTREPRN